MTVLTHKIRASIRRVVQGRGLTYQQLRALIYRVVIHDYVMALHAYSIYKREQYIRELIQ